MKVYTVKIVHKDFHILSHECFLTDKEAEQQGEHMIAQYHKVIGNENDLFFNDVQEHILVKGGEPSMAVHKRKDLVL